MDGITHETYDIQIEPKLPLGTVPIVMEEAFRSIDKLSFSFLSITEKNGRANVGTGCDAWCFFQYCSVAIF